MSDDQCPEVTIAACPKTATDSTTAAASAATATWATAARARRCGGAPAATHHDAFDSGSDAWQIWREIHRDSKVLLAFFWRFLYFYVPCLCGISCGEVCALKQVRSLFLSPTMIEVPLRLDCTKQAGWSSNASKGRPQLSLIHEVSRSQA